MTEQSTSKAKARKVGDVVEIGEGKSVVYPDGYTTVTVTGGSFVLDRPGTFVVDGIEVDAK